MIPTEIPMGGNGTFDFSRAVVEGKIATFSGDGRRLFEPRSSLENRVLNVNKQVLLSADINQNL